MRPKEPPISDEHIILHFHSLRDWDNANQYAICSFFANLESQEGLPPSETSYCRSRSLPVKLHWRRWFKKKRRQESQETTLINSLASIYSIYDHINREMNLNKMGRQTVSITTPSSEGQVLFLFQHSSTAQYTDSTTLFKSVYAIQSSNLPPRPFWSSLKHLPCISSQLRHLDVYVYPL